MQSNLSDIPPFIPPIWCRNGHIQTIAGWLLSHPRKPACDTEEISTPDGDFLQLDVVEGQKIVP